MHCLDSLESCEAITRPCCPAASRQGKACCKLRARVTVPAPLPLTCGRLQHDSNVVVAKLDATTNDIPSPKISVRGYPTLVFVSAKGDGEHSCFCG